MALSTIILEVLDGPAAGRVFRFNTTDTFVLGRSDTAQLRLLDDVHLSRNHFRIEIDPPRCLVRDLSSANGTFVNGERISECWLESGDTISGGQTRILVRIEESADDALGRTLVSFSHAAAADFSVSRYPEQIGPWKIADQIGNGAIGTVHRAVHQHSGEIVAIKLVPVDDRSEQTLKSFRRECDVLASLSHKRIVRYISSGVHGNFMYLVTEYVTEIDIREVLRSVDLRNRIRIAGSLMRQVLDGLHFAHVRGLVHRDIKPRNILISRGGYGVRAKIADFGLAKCFRSAGQSGFTLENEVKGTLSFMAPEQVASSLYATPQCDVFSAGATLYAWISDHLIYDSSGHDSIEQVLKRGPVPIQQRSPDIPNDVAHVISKALAMDPGQRYATADRMREALSEVVENV